MSKPNPILRALPISGIVTIIAWLLTVISGIQTSNPEAAAFLTLLIFLLSYIETYLQKQEPDTYYPTFSPLPVPTPQPEPAPTTTNVGKPTDLGGVQKVPINYNLPIGTKISYRGVMLTVGQAAGRDLVSASGSPVPPDAVYLGGGAFFLNGTYYE